MLYFELFKPFVKLNLNFVGHFLNILRYFGLKFPNFVLSMIS